MTSQPQSKEPIPYRIGEWLPSDQAVLDKWLKELIAKVDDAPKPLHPVIEEFRIN